MLISLMLLFQEILLRLSQKALCFYESELQERNRSTWQCSAGSLSIEIGNKTRKKRSNEDSYIKHYVTYKSPRDRNA